MAPPCRCSGIGSKDLCMHQEEVEEEDDDDDEEEEDEEEEVSVCFGASCTEACSAPWTCNCHVSVDGDCMLQDKPLPKKAKTQAPKVDVSAAQGSSTVFVKNLPWSANEESLTEFFSDCGAVASVRVGVLLCPPSSYMLVRSGPTMQGRQANMAWGNGFVDLGALGALISNAVAMFTQVWIMRPAGPRVLHMCNSRRSRALQQQLPGVALRWRVVSCSSTRPRSVLLVGTHPTPIAMVGCARHSWNSAPRPPCCTVLSRGPRLSLVCRPEF